MPELVRNDLEFALAAFQDAQLESSARDSVRSEAMVLGDRHRRVRNSISHGNPVGDPALLSTRDFSSRRADAAIWLALRGYSSGESVADLLEAESATRLADRARMAAGESYVDRYPEP